MSRRIWVIPAAFSGTPNEPGVLLQDARQSPRLVDVGGEAVLGAITSSFVNLEQGEVEAGQPLCAKVKSAANKAEVREAFKPNFTTTLQPNKT